MGGPRMDPEVRAFIIEVMTAMGQMDHPRGKGSQDGVMTMKTEVRAYLVAKGWWEILEPERAEELRRLYGIEPTVRKLGEG